jgi:hypothetical protein
VDHDLSKVVFHAGRTEYGYQHADAYREIEVQRAAVLDSRRIITKEDPTWDSPPTLN